jgi:hypothetical protein
VLPRCTEQLPGCKSVLLYWFVSCCFSVNSGMCSCSSVQAYTRCWRCPCVLLPVDCCLSLVSPAAACSPASCGVCCGGCPSWRTCPHPHGWPAGWQQHASSCTSLMLRGWRMLPGRWRHWDTCLTSCGCVRLLALWHTGSGGRDGLARRFFTLLHTGHAHARSTGVAVACLPVL